MSYSARDGRRAAVNVKRPRPWKSLEEHAEEDAFEFDPRALLDLRVWNAARRPHLAGLGGIPVMEPPSASADESAAAAAEQCSCSPLLQSFLDSLHSHHVPNNINSKQSATIRNTSTEKNNNQTSERVEKEEKEGNNDSAVEGTFVEESVSPLARLEKGSAATLTRGQHARFLALYNQQQHGAGSTKQGTASKQDVKSVVQAVQAERYMYAQALAAVWTDNTHIFLHGFRVPGPASVFVQAHSQWVQRIRHNWMEFAASDADNNSSTTSSCSMTFGPCRQVISLGPTVAGAGAGAGATSISASASTTSKHSTTNIQNAMMDFLFSSARVVEATESTDVPCIRVPTLTSDNRNNDTKKNDGGGGGGNHEDGSSRGGWIEKVMEVGDKQPMPLRPAPVLSPRGGGVPQQQWMHQDERAKQLAIQHGATVVMTDRTLETLLQRRANHNAQDTTTLGCGNWMIPLTRWHSMIEHKTQSTSTRTRTRGVLAKNDNAIVVMEDPLPQPSSPRESLTHGFEAAMYNHLMSPPPRNDNDNAKAASPMESQVQYVYTIVTLPPQENAAPTAPPFRVLVRSTNCLLDENNGEAPVKLQIHLEYWKDAREVALGEDAARWMMYKLLQPSSRVVVARIHPQEATLLGLEEKSIAHAWTEGSTTNSMGLAGKKDALDLQRKIQAFIEKLPKASDKKDDTSDVHDEDGTSASTSTSNKEDIRQALKVLQNMLDPFDPALYFKVAIDLIRSTTSMFLTREETNNDWKLVCYPAIIGAASPASMTTSCWDHRAASVHEPVSSSVEKKQPKFCISLEAQLSQADAVLLTKPILLTCFRPWTWNNSVSFQNDPHRIPFTFPPKEDTSTKKSFHKSHAKKKTSLSR
eukprot:scaffold38730_cov53-Attheya_sp.AAC.5